MVLAIELEIHWLGAYGISSLAVHIKSIYTYRDPVNNKTYGAGAVDFIVPCVAIGVSTGVITRNWSKKAATTAAVLCAISLFSVFVLEMKMFGNSADMAWNEIIKIDYASLMLVGVKYLIVILFLCHYLRAITSAAANRRIKE